ncbi:hypothetical protein PRVXH_001595 [Proteinivorax hydrogeniformans]|uniref:Uncharacterized protein n=1 Tax=Proteinivorax hydrogeniformans TaxID=1826727 RepID=A0AAU8HRA5_9FIRM
MLAVLYKAKDQKELSGQYKEIDLDKELLPLVKKARLHDNFEDIKVIIHEALDKLDTFEEATIKNKLNSILEG